MTQAQLAAELAELGVNLSPRLLESWREKGLLPPLRQIGQGRGPGAKWFWDSDIVFDQAVAAHCLLENYRRVDAAVCNLWAAGFSVSADKLRRSWLKCIERDQKSLQREVSRAKGDLYEVAKRRLRTMNSQLKKHASAREHIIALLRGEHDDSEEHKYWQRVAESVVDWYGSPKHQTSGESEADTLETIFGHLIGEQCEWSLDDEERDDAEFRYLMAQSLAAVDWSMDTGLPSQDLYNTIKGFWDKTDYPTIFRVESSKQFVQSLTDDEIDRTRQSLARIRELFAHCFELRDGRTDKIQTIRKQLGVMDGLGPFAARVIISLQRKRPDWPLGESISALHAFVKSVKLDDLLKQNKSGALLSPRVHEQWEIVRQELSELWKPLLPENQKK